MALKGDRYEAQTDISFFCDTVSEKGGVAVLYTGGSGAALDQSEAEVKYESDSSGKKPIGILLNDVVNKDLTQTHLNWYKNEVQKGSKVTLMTQGWVDTDMIYPEMTITAGDTAYVGPSGLLVNALSTGGEPTVGRFLSSKDEDGYAKVSVNLP